MKKIILILAMFLPSLALAQLSDLRRQQQEQVDVPIEASRSIDRLLTTQQTRAALPPGTTEEENRRLKNELIDLRVERDLLEEENDYLHHLIASMEADLMCASTECVPADVVMQEKIMMHVTYSLSMYKMAELMKAYLPSDNVEAHRQAQEIMEGAKNDLELLGFDTSNPSTFPELNDLLNDLSLN